MFDAMDVLILSYLLVAAGELALDTQGKTLVILANNLGMLIGAALFGRLADKFGRRKIFIATLLLYSLGTGAAALARSWLEFAVVRFFAGLGLGGELPVVATYVSENSPPERRGRNVVLLESFWSLGAVLAAATSLYLFTSIGWRASLVLLSLTAFYALVIRLALPESQRWIESRGARPPEAAAAPRVDLHRLSIVSSIWLMLAFGYYGAFLWLPTMLVKERGFTYVGTYEFMFITTLAQLPGYFSAAYLVEKLGRRPVGSLYFLLSAVSAVLFTYSRASGELVVWALALNFFNLGVWGVIYAYTPELFPTAVRGAATGMSGSAARVGMILGPMLYPLYSSSALIIIAAVWATASALIWLLPETKGRAV
ncbi:MFS transporter [Pyrobaculum sp. 3827-6]|uniref:MFS transporter n=1 Tax=Pyrobaculum sp. 3827-6 TaxID=2983604 RepID=UPI0021D94C28|nr:MFS transporter [Pyrobaculum sp. 3827-6]MCU7786602.1 MFS transporter [Pyrobaculum sp. 3827-6]